MSVFSITGKIKTYYMSFFLEKLYYFGVNINKLAQIFRSKLII